MKKIPYLTPSSCREKRNKRIINAENFHYGSVNNGEKIDIYHDDNLQLFFLNPGDEDNRTNKKKANDNRIRNLKVIVISNKVNDKYSSYKIKEMWEEICKVQDILNDDEVIRLYMLIYRLAYLYDFNIDDLNKPNQEFFDDIDELQKIINLKNYNFDLKAFLGLLDLFGWNEDYKYQVGEINSKKSMTGRLNSLLCMISVPYEIRKLKQSTNGDLNYDNIVKMCYDFSISRGLYTLKAEEIKKVLSNYLLDDD